MFIQMKDERIYPVIRIVAQAPQWDLALLEVSMPIQDSVPLSVQRAFPPLVRMSLLSEHLKACRTFYPQGRLLP